MSFKRVQTSTATSNQLDIPIFAPNPWVRNKAWPTLTGPLDTDQKLVGLFAVYPDQDNLLAMFATVTGAANYIVNWGDGTPNSTVTQNNQINKNYDYNASGLVGTDLPVTLVAATDRVTLSTNPYSDGDPVQFYQLSSSTGLAEQTTYYVINSNPTFFQVALTPGGSAVDITNAGSAKMLPYRIAVVEVTPDTGGTFTAIDVARTHNQSGLQTGYTVNWLEIKAASNSLTTGGIFSSTAAVSRLLENLEYYGLFVGGAINGETSSLQRVVLRFTNSTNFALSSFFLNKRALYDVTIETLGAGKVSLATSAFSGCTRLTFAPLFDTSAVTDMSSMFNGCRSLRAVPTYDTSSVTTMASMFLDCGNLTSVPLFNTASVTNMSSMFQNCTQIEEVPVFNTASVTTMANMFNTCRRLKRAPAFNMAAVTSCLTMFATCNTLQEVPSYNFGAGSSINLTSMFATCPTLQVVPSMSGANVTNVSSMFNACTNLVKVGNLNFPAATNWNSMFSGCTSLQDVGQLTTTAATTMSSMFSNCTALPTIKAMDMNGVTDASSMFSGCTNLVSVPLMDTSTVTNVNSMFSNCGGLVSLPAFNLTGVSSSGNAGAWVGSCRLFRIQASNLRFTHSIASNCLSGTNLNEYYTNLPTITGQTLTITGNYGSTTDNPAIATAKGWAVTGT